MSNFEMFRKLCGDSTLQNVVIVTNMWGQVDPEVGEAREAELVKRDILFKPILDKGAQIARNENTVTSAQKIIRLVLNNHPLPRTPSPIQDATVYYSIDNCSGGSEVYTLSAGSGCLRSGHRVGFPVGFPLFASVTYIPR